MCELGFVQKLFESLAIAVPVAIVTVVLAFGKFKSEKWWDRKFQCYFEAIDSLKHLMKICNDLARIRSDGASCSEDAIQKYASDFVDIRDSLEGIQSCGELLLSENANRLLSAFCNNLFGIVFDSESEKLISTIYIDANNCLCSLIPMAKSDLKKRAMFGLFG